jgi:proteic killer suppression protein
MIRNFKDKALRRYFESGNAKGLAVQNLDRVSRILTALNGATRPADLDLPGLRWHNLAPRQPSRYSVWVSGNYRITYAFEGKNAVDVDLEDYH